jgi:hypothetical protein
MTGLKPSPVKGLPILIARAASWVIADKSRENKNKIW